SQLHQKAFVRKPSLCLFYKISDQTIPSVLRLQLMYRLYHAAGDSTNQLPPIFHYQKISIFCESVENPLTAI
ncbi:MAG: hypothetical protein ACLVKR_08330, partial [Lachnospiraceae bacterium]